MSQIWIVCTTRDYYEGFTVVRAFKTESAAQNYVEFCEAIMQRINGIQERRIAKNVRYCTDFGRSQFDKITLAFCGIRSYGCESRYFWADSVPFSG